MERIADEWALIVLGDRNGLTGEVLKENVFDSGDKDAKYRSQRVRRTRLQAALVKQVPEGIIKLRKRLLSLTDLGVEGVKLVFEDGEEVVADLVIGGDGIRSVSIYNCFLVLHVSNSERS
jgi:salicylate hydroxylase